MNDLTKHNLGSGPLGDNHVNFDQFHMKLMDSDNQRKYLLPPLIMVGAVGIVAYFAIKRLRGE